MPRFHLHIHNGLGFTPDEEGVELPDLLTAHEEAVKGARSLLCGELMEGRLDLSGRIEIADAGDRIIDVVRFGDVVTVVEGEGE